MAQSSHVRVEHIHFLHQAAEGSLCCLANFLINTFGLKITRVHSIHHYMSHASDYTHSLNAWNTQFHAISAFNSLQSCMRLPIGMELVANSTKL